MLPNTGCFRCLQFKRNHTKVHGALSDAADWLLTKPIPLDAAEPLTYMLLSVRKECSLATRISQMLLQGSFSSSITSTTFLHSSSHASFVYFIKYKVFIFTFNFFNCLFLSYHIVFLARSGTFHLSIPNSLIPRIKEDPLWLPLCGASCFRKDLYKQPGFGDNLLFKTLLKLILKKKLVGVGPLASWAQQYANPAQFCQFFVLYYLLLSHASFASFVFLIIGT